MFQTNWSPSENIIDKYLFLKHEKESWIYKTVQAMLEFLFHIFKVWLSTLQIQKAFFFSVEKRQWTNGKVRHWTSKICSTVLETKYWLRQVYALSSYPFRSSGSRKNEAHKLRNSLIFSTALCRKRMQRSNFDGILHFANEFCHTVFTRKSVSRKRPISQFRQKKKKKCNFSPTVMLLKTATDYLWKSVKHKSFRLKCGRNTNINVLLN